MTTFHLKNGLTLTGKILNEGLSSLVLLLDPASRRVLRDAAGSATLPASITIDTRDVAERVALV